MPVFRIKTPRAQDSAESLADWLEVEALRSENGVGSLRELSQTLSLAGTKDEPNAEDYEPRVSVDDLTHVAAEIERRSLAAGTDAYPFTSGGAGASISLNAGWQNKTYIWLLLLTYLDARGYFSIKRRKLFHARLFEGLAAAAAHAYLGGVANHAAVYRFGWPRPSPNAADFKGALDELAKVTGGVALKYIVPKWEKDERLDIFAWRRFPDERCNRLTLFGQCAGGDDWDVKGPQPKRFLGVWLKLHAPDAWPVLFLPRLLSSEEYIKEGQVSLILDRCRIAHLVPTINAPDLTEQGFSVWTGKALQKLGTRAKPNPSRGNQIAA
jgi:hypothetical protein